MILCCFFFSSRRRHTRLQGDWSSDVCSSDLGAVIREGQQFMQAFPSAPNLEQVGLLLADAYARENRTQQEFALYDTELAELAKRADGVPLGAKTSGQHSFDRNVHTEPSTFAQAEAQGESEQSESTAPGEHRAFSTESSAVVNAPKNAQAWYSEYLERYLSRLVSMKQVPEALAVLRKEVDRNPNDPGLYERLAQFLEQNRLGQEQEQVYERAIQQFSDRSWYHKLARFYLRYRRDSDFLQLSQRVVKVFSGTELESYFSDVGFGRDYYVRLNEFALARFPHDLLFVRNLLNAYQRSYPTNEKWESLIRQHWWESEDLRNRYFEYLSRTDRKSVV